MIKRAICTTLSLLLCFSLFSLNTFAEGEAGTLSSGAPFELKCKSAVLMDATSGTVLYEQNATEPLPPASVTKIMTLLLVMEAIDQGKTKLDDQVSVSETAAGMGGSQIYLEVGETMSVEDMLKSVVISSANDAAVALAEHVSGDLDSFVQQMNQKASELGMSATHFENATGLDDTAQNHLTSALDIAKMSRALLAYPDILKYSSIWMDTVRGGTFGLTNTNRLVRFYQGATGLKTGSTSKAGFCVSATAERDGLSLICVIMGAETRDERNAMATKLLDWGFANYAQYQASERVPQSIDVVGGTQSSCPIKAETFSCLVPKGKASAVQSTLSLPERLSAPLEQGQIVGKIEYTLDGTVLGSADITAQANVPKISFWGVWQRLLAQLLFA